MRFVFYVVAAVLGVSAVLWLVRKPGPVRPISEADRAGVEKLAREGRHIDALRAYREATGASLKDAKAAVEAMEKAS